MLLSFGSSSVTAVTAEPRFRHNRIPLRKRKSKAPLREVLPLLYSGSQKCARDLLLS